MIVVSSEHDNLSAHAFLRMSVSPDNLSWEFELWTSYVAPRHDAHPLSSEVGPPRAADVPKVQDRQNGDNDALLPMPWL